MASVSVDDKIEISVLRDEGQSLGLALRGFPTGVLRVDKVLPEGLVNEWKKEHPQCDLKQGMYVESVNGFVDAPPQLYVVLLLLLRNINLVLSKNQPAMSAPDTQSDREKGEMIRAKINAPSGVRHDLNLYFVDSLVIVIDVSEGPIAEWNQQHPDKAISVGDRLVYVNGKGGDRLSENMDQSGDVALTFQRGGSVLFDASDTLSEQIVDEIPSMVWDRASDECFGQSCTICLEEFEDGEAVRRLPCKHCYHQHCIKKWLTTKSTVCPVCACAADLKPCHH